MLRVWARRDVVSTVGNRRATANRRIPAITNSTANSRKTTITTMPAASGRPAIDQDAHSVVKNAISSRPPAVACTAIRGISRGPLVMSAPGGRA